jgi:hypothetical protein
MTGSGILRTFRAVALLIALGGFALHQAKADATLDFNLGGAGGGAINFAGGTNPLTGSNIPIRLLASNGTPLNSGQTLSVTSGFLNFTTGNLISYAGGLLTFAGNGNLSINGIISAIGITTQQTLLSGSFLGATFNVNTGAASLFIGTGADTKNPTLVSHFFPTAPANWIFAGTILGGRPTLNSITHAFRAAVQANSVDILNTAVPEAGSIFLLGTSLLATAFIMRRRRKVLSQ